MLKDDNHDFHKITCARDALEDYKWSSRADSSLLFVPAACAISLVGCAMLGGVPFAGSVAGPWLLVLGMVGLAFLVIPISEYRMRAGNIEGRQEVLNSLLGRLNGSIKGIQTLKDASKYEKILKELAEAKNAADSKIAALKVEKVAKGSCLRSVSLFFGACVRGKAASTGSSDQNAALVESRFLC